MSSPASELVKKYFDREKGQLRSTMIRAGAGAGKTTELVKRVISMALIQKKKKNDWPRLVVTTFTRKATQELRERLSLAALTLNHPEVLNELNKIEPNLDVQGLIRYVQNSQSLHISTLHGILAVFLRQHGQAIELSPDFRFIDERKAEKLMKLAISELAKSDSQFTEDFLILRERVDFTNLIKSIRQWWSAQLETKNHFKKIDTLEIKKQKNIKFKEIQKKCRQILSDIEHLELTETWQARKAGFQFLAKKLSDLEKKIADNTVTSQGIDTKQQALDLHSVLAEFLQSKGRGALKNKTIPSDSIELAQSIYDSAKELINPIWDEKNIEDLDQLMSSFERVAQKTSEKIVQKKIESSSLTMDDLELFSLLLIQKQPNLAMQFSQDWDLWLIDEYQDTSPRQVQLIERLAQTSPQFLVGDPQQSIYLFRGARSEVFFEAQKKMTADGAELVEQMTNYRTASPVLEFMNQLFVASSSQLTPMQAGSSEKIDSPEFAVQAFAIQKDKNEKGKISSLQAQSVVNHILFLLRAGVREEDICILARKKKDLREMCQKAQALAIPCQLHVSGEFYRRQEVQDALFVLKFVMNPLDNINLISLLRSPWVTCTDQDILKICDKKIMYFWPQLLKHHEQNDRLAETARSLKKLIDHSQQVGFIRAWRDFLVESGFFKYAQQLDPSGRREANLWKLISMLAAEQKKPGFQILEFLKNKDVVDIEESSDSDACPVVEPKRVQFMTVHASKGLQFPYVIVPFLEDSNVKIQRSFFAFDSNNQQWSLCPKDPETQEWIVPPAIENYFENEKTRSAQEIDRVYYVALTRAQKGLHLFYSNSKENNWTQALEETANRANLLKAIPSQDIFVENKLCKEPIDLSNQTQTVRKHQWNQIQTVPREQKVSVTKIVEWMSASHSADHAIGSVEKNSVTQSKTEIAQSKNAQNIAALLQRAHRGTRVHSLFEALKYQSDLNFMTGDEEKLALDFLNQEKGHFIKDIIQSGYVEWGFTCKLGEYLLQGQIDLWGYNKKNELVIVDYKTGRIENADKAFLQMQIYAWAVQKILNIRKKIQLAAVYPFEQQVLFKGADDYDKIEQSLFTLLAESVTSKSVSYD